MHYQFAFLLCALLASFPFSACAQALDAGAWEEQRGRFRSAYRDLVAGDMAQYYQNVKGLEDYPLHYYLRYLYLNNNLDSVSFADLRKFFIRYNDTPLAEMLESTWLSKLAAAEDWPGYVAAYTPQRNVEHRCLYVYARLQSGLQLENLWRDAAKLWVVGKSQPKACDPLFAEFYKSPELNETNVRKRIDLSLANREIGLAMYLTRYSNDPSVQQRVQQWQKAKRDPAGFLDRAELKDTGANRDLAVYAFTRMARNHAEDAHTLWQYYRTRYKFTAEQKGEVERTIAIHAYWQNHPQAGTWLAELDPRYATDTVHLLRFQRALKNSDWQGILELIERFPAAEQSHLQWRYWRARALEHTGKSDAARALYKKLAQQRDYYGFLAAQRLNQSFAIVHKPLSYSESELNRLLTKYPGLLRAREFYLLKMLNNARREWVYSVDKQLTPLELPMAADFARDIGWFERAIFTAGKARAFDDLDMRFPILFRTYVDAAAKEQNLDPAWVYGIIRQESAFTVDVRSSAGALGLMQLLPSTGKLMADKVGIELEEVETDLIDVENNIRLGAAYLRHVLDRFGGNYMLATAAYNAGPGRVQRWREQNDCLPADVWVELIPFRETRGYVRRVMEYTSIFEARLGLPQTGLRLAPSRSDQCPSPVSTGGGSTKVGAR